MPRTKAQYMRKSGSMYRDANKQDNYPASPRTETDSDIDRRARIDQGLESTSGAAGRNRLAEACGFSVWTYNSPSYEAYEPFQAGTDRRKPLETPLETARDPSSHENLSYRIRLPKHGPIPKSKQHGQEPYTRGVEGDLWVREEVTP